MSDNIRRDVRDSEIRQAQQQRLARDTRMAQTVGEAHRLAFRDRFPGQLEHCMRLVSERLQSCLFKNDQCDLSRPETWNAGTADIRDLSEALWALEQVRQHWPMPDSQDQ
jgi:hypothetical protein